MKVKTLRDGTPVPVIGLGTWRIGGEMTPDLARDRQGEEALKTAIRLGYRHIDTAEMYGGGHTEELVGRAIRGFDRGQLFLTTKVWPGHLRYPDVLRSLENSLRRLGTEYVDFYLIHWPDPHSPLEETFRAFNELVRAGKVRHVGVSNFDRPLLERALELSEFPIATDQVPYSLADRRAASEGLLDYCRGQGILLTAYEPLAKGALLSRPGLLKVARESGVGPAGLALAWLIRQEGVVTVVMSMDEEHQRRNLAAGDLELPAEVAARLDGLA